MTDLIGDIRDVPSLTDAQILSIMRRAPQIKKFLDEVAEEATARAMSGNPVEGTKLVAGRSARSWKPDAEKQLYGRLEHLEDQGVDSVADILYEPQKLKSPASLEKEIGAKEFKALLDLVQTSEGKPTLVFSEDPRPVYAPKKKAAELFENEWE
jgi:hypothetical protein